MKKLIIIMVAIHSLAQAQIVRINAPKINFIPSQDKKLIQYNYGRLISYTEPFVVVVELPQADEYVVLSREADNLEISRSLGIDISKYRTYMILNPERYLQLADIPRFSSEIEQESPVRTLFSD